MFGIGFAKPGKSRLINLNGITYAVETSTNPTAATIKIDNDGKLYTRQNVASYAFNQNWCTPTSDAPADYQVRYTAATGDTGDLTVSSAEDAWWNILTSGDWTIAIQDTVDGGLGKSATFTIEIRKGIGATVASASFTLTANYTIP